MANINKSIDRTKNQLESISENLEKNKARLSELEKAKSDAREERMFLENNRDKMDDNVAETLEKETNEAYEAVSKEGKELSVEMITDIKKLDSLKEERQEALDAANEAKESERRLVESAKEHGIIVPESQTIRQNITDNTSLLDDILKKMQDADEIAQKLSML